jgi:deoxycytidine triphosphate deaminase
MYKNPGQIVADKIVIGITNDSQIQPNAIDFSVDKMFKIDPTPFYLSNDKKRRVMRTLTPVQMTDSQSVGHMFGDLNPETIAERVSGWLLEPGGRYEGTSSMYVEVPENMAAVLLIKSTLNRNAIKMISGLYDSGFKGNIGFTIHNPIGYSFIEVGALIGQIAFVESESVGVYTGGYNTKDGQHWTELDTDAAKSKWIVETDEITTPSNEPLNVKNKKPK